MSEKKTILHVDDNEANRYAVSRSLTKAGFDVSEATSGEHLELHVTYDRGNAQRGAPSDTRFYSAKNPTYYQLSRQEQVLDILRSVTASPQDRVHEFQFTCVGGSFASICDGSQKVLSCDNIQWISQEIFQPWAFGHHLLLLGSVRVLFMETTHTDRLRPARPS